MPTNVVKCPECGAKSKVHGVKTFVCCGTKWSINDCLVTPKSEQTEDEKLENTPIGDIEEVDLNEKKLPVRRKEAKVKNDEMLCPYCGGDVYLTERVDVYYCKRCDQYLVEE